jgi:hypothetical protein
MNDLPTPVTVALCKSAQSERCDDPAYRDTIQVGGSVPENIAPDVQTEWAVESPTGQLLGCVVLYWQHYPGHEMAVRVSSALSWANPCSDSTPIAESND